MASNAAKRQLMVSSLVLGALAAGWSGSRASAAAAVTASQSITLGQVVVTARKRAENLQRVPIAVTTQTGKQLDQQRITQPTDLQRIVPSLQARIASGADNGLVVDLRGQEAGDTLLGVSQPVGLYQDTVNIPHPFGSNSSFFDIARVEVLKGPQGTLYGRNTTGGAINIITNDADYRGVHGFLMGEAGNYNEWKVGGAVNVPIVNDKLAVRIGYQHWGEEGYGHSIVTGQKFGGDHNDDTVRAHVKFDPVSNFDADFEVEYSQLRHTAPQITVDYLSPTSFYPLASNAYLSNPAVYGPEILAAEFGNPAAFGAVLAAGNAILAPCVYGGAGHTGGYYTNCSATQQYDHLTEWHGGLDLKWNITPDVMLRSITGLHSFKDFKVFDLDSTPAQILEVGVGSNGLHLDVPGNPIAFPLLPDQESTQWTQEFDLQGSKMFGGVLDWLVGGFMSWDNGDGAQQSTDAVELTFVNFAPPGLSSHDGLSNKTNTWAMYTQEDIHVTKMLSITLGGRYTSEDITQVLSNWNYDAEAGFYYCNGNFAELPPNPANPGTCANLPDATGPNGAFQHAHSNGLSYLASLNLQLTDDILVYFKTSRGFRGGAFGRSYQAPAKPETNVDYELGLKGDFLEHRLRVDLDGYDTQYNNKQVSTEVCSGGSLPTLAGCPSGQTTSTLLLNAATARIRGVELETTAIPFEGMSVFLEGSYLDAVYTKFPNAISNSGAAVDATGNNMGVEPIWQGDVGGRYEHPLGPGVLGVQADYAMRGSVPLNRLNTDLGLPPGLQKNMDGFVGLFNARVDFHLPDQGLTLAFWGTNLTGVKWSLLSLPSAFTGMGTVVAQAPLEFGFSIRKTFGGEQ